MTNDEREVTRVLEEAVRAAVGPERSRTAGPGPAEQDAAEGENGGGEQRPAAESAMGLGSRSSLLTGMESVVSAAAGGSGTSKAVSWMNPLVGGLMGLFGGGEEATEVVLPKAARRARIDYQAGFAGTDGELVQIDRDESGRLRRATPPAAQVVVNVEAMDSRSFLDRTPEIAEAVKRALLESEGLGRVMDEV